MAFLLRRSRLFRWLGDFLLLDGAGAGSCPGIGGGGACWQLGKAGVGVFALQGRRKTGGPMRILNMDWPLIHILVQTRVE